MATAGAAAAAAQMTYAVASAGGMVRVEPDVFLTLLDRSENPLVVYSSMWVLFIGRQHQYLTTYRGLTFVTRSPEPLILSKAVELIEAKSMFLPV